MWKWATKWPDPEQTDPNNTVLDELWNDFKLTPEVEIRNRLRALVISAHAIRWEGAAASQQSRSWNNNFLILDEPTNHPTLTARKYWNALIDLTAPCSLSAMTVTLSIAATEDIELFKFCVDLYLSDYDYYSEKKSKAGALREETEQTSCPDKPAPANIISFKRKTRKNSATRPVACINWKRKTSTWRTPSAST